MTTLLTIALFAIPTESLLNVNAAEIDSEHTRQQCRIGRSWAEEHGHVFLLVTDDILRRGPCLDNLKKMWRYSRFQVSALTTRQCVALLAEYPEGLPFLDLATILADGQGQPLMQSPLIYALLFQQTLVTDLNQPLTPSSRLFLAFAEPSLRPPDILSLV